VFSFNASTLFTRKLQLLLLITPKILSKLVSILGFTASGPFVFCYPWPNDLYSQNPDIVSQYSRGGTIVVDGSPAEQRLSIHFSSHSTEEQTISCIQETSFSA